MTETSKADEAARIAGRTGGHTWRMSEPRQPNRDSKEPDATPLAALVYDHALVLAGSPAVDRREAVAELVGLARADPETLEAARDRCEVMLAEERPGDRALIRAFGLLSAAADRAAALRAEHGIGPGEH